MASSADTATADGHGDGAGETRRDFLMLATAAFGAVGMGAVAWPFIDQMNPAADTLAASTAEFNLEPVEEGQRVTIKWRGKPVFITKRTKAQIAQARKDDTVEMVDPQKDADRVKKVEWLIMVGVCTHLGCIPQGNKKGELLGEFGGWFCPCHGSHYDTSGRIRKGPAPKNLPIPDYVFLPDNKTVQIG